VKDWGAGSYYGTGLSELTNAPKPILIARASMAAQIDNTKYVDFIRREEGRFWGVLYEKPEQKGTILLAWAGDEGRVELAGLDGHEFERVDIMGNAQSKSDILAVTEEPAFFHTPLTPQQVKDALAKVTYRVTREPVPLPTFRNDNKPDVPLLPDYVTVKEGPGRDWFIDLRPYANMGLADDAPGDGKGGWSDEGSLNDMREMPVGRLEFYGVPFDVIDPETNGGKSVITLKGTRITPKLPQSVKNIAVGDKKARALFFLHSAAWGTPGDIGKYVIRYQDGVTVDVPLVSPVNINNWHTGYEKTETGKPIPVLVTNTVTGKAAWRYPRVYEWQNQRLDVPISSFDFVSNADIQSPILIAVTAVR
jgi:hypothetical protein